MRRRREKDRLQTNMEEGSENKIENERQERKSQEVSQRKHKAGQRRPKKTVEARRE